MDKIDKIQKVLDKIYGHLAITQERESELIGQGRKIGYSDGYKAGYESGFDAGFKEGKVFPNKPIE